MGDDLGPNGFQMRGIDVSRKALGDGAQGCEFSRASGPYSGESHYVCRIDVAGHTLAIFIYEDEAEFSIDDDRIDRRFEKWDYRSSDELIADFDRRLREALASLRPTQQRP